jgi:hypothetical protein
VKTAEASHCNEKNLANNQYVIEPQQGFGYGENEKNSFSIGIYYNR